MDLSQDDITARDIASAYEGLVARAATSTDAALQAELAGLRATFQKRAGAFTRDDPWFDPRSRALWDFVLTREGFAARVVAAGGPALPAAAERLAPWLARAHRGLFVVQELEDGAAGGASSATLKDLWSGAELRVRVLDDAQRIALTHATSAMDGRVASIGAASGALYLLPGVVHHADDAMDPLHAVVAAARGRGLGRDDALDALLRMELVLRSSSRVKASFAYRISSLPRESLP